MNYKFFETTSQIFKRRTKEKITNIGNETKINSFSCTVPKYSTSQKYGIPGIDKVMYVSRIMQTVLFKQLPVLREPVV